MIKLYPSLMAADLLHLSNEITRLEPYCDGFHIDVMDNHFVPNLTFGIDTVNAIGRITHKQLWIHLMVTDPLSIINRLTLPKESIISFHPEALSHSTQVIDSIKTHGWKTSISLKPRTSIKSVTSLLPVLDQVVLMSVEPGFAGQSFKSEVIEKINPLIAERNAQNLSFSIGMDGGINTHNISKLIADGAQDFAIGSAFFKEDPSVWHQYHTQKAGQ